MGETIEFVILHTNDLHSSFESMPLIRSFFQYYERHVPPEQLLRFDVGDHMDRMRPETEGTMGRANIDVMNAAGYDAAAPGNNEGLTFPGDVLDDLYGSCARFPVVATNLKRMAGPPTAWNRPSLVLERCGVRLGIIGLTAPFNDFYKELGWHASDPIAAAAEEAARLRRERDAHFIIALSHLGLSADRRLAETVRDIDLILGGHTHHVLDELLRVGDVRIGAAGKLGSHVGVVRLSVDKGSLRATDCVGGAVPLNGAAPDPLTASLIERRAFEAGAVLQRVIAHLPEPLPAAYDRESPLGNLLANALRLHCNADIGIVNAGQLLGGLEAGPVQAARLHAICPSPINPCSMMLRGAHLLQAVEESLNDSHMNRTIRGFGFRGDRLGTLCLDGMTVEIDDSSPAHPKVNRAFVGGAPLEPETWYRIGTIDMFTFRVGYESLANGESIAYYLPEFLRDLLARALLEPDARRRIEEAKRPKRLRIVGY